MGSAATRAERVVDHAFVENVAASNLHMHIPPPAQIEVVAP